MAIFSKKSIKVTYDKTVFLPTIWSGLELSTFRARKLGGIAKEALFFSRKLGKDVGCQLQTALRISLSFCVWKLGGSWGEILESVC